MAIDQPGQLGPDSEDGEFVFYGADAPPMLRMMLAAVVFASGPGFPGFSAWLEQGNFHGAPIDVNTGALKWNLASAGLMILRVLDG